MEVLENGPLRAKIRVSYVAIRPCWYTGSMLTWSPASENGYFTCTITLEAGQQSIIIEQETDGHPTWNVDMNTGVNADRARYDGANSTDIAHGHNYDGTKYEAMHTRADMEAEINLSDTGVRNNYGWRGQGDTPVNCVMYPRIYNWFTWGNDSGYYWHAYNSAGGPNSNVWGIFQGRSGAVIGGVFMAGGAGTYGKPSSGTPTEHGFWTYMQGGVEDLICIVSSPSEYSWVARARIYQRILVTL